MRKYTARQFSGRNGRLNLGRLVESLEERLLMTGSGGDDMAHSMPPEISMLSVAGPQTSPFAPPESNGQTFVVNGGAGLDTGCTYSSGGPLVFDVMIDRVVGDVSKLLANKLISPMVRLEMPAFDIDFDGSYPPERDRVSINGHVVPGEYLTGADGVWKLNSFDIPVEWLNFPTDANSPAANTIQIDIDVHPDSPGGRWCTTIDWASLTIEKLAPPVVFVHGILSNMNGWTSPWRNRLESMGLLTEGINLGSEQGLLVLDSIGQNASDIANLVNSLTRNGNVPGRWGADRVVIVSHSKGGIDSRHFVETSDKVESLIQIGTPNAGSPLANLVQAGAVGLTGLVGAALINVLAGPGGIQLTTDFMETYNQFHGYNPDTLYVSQAGDYRFGGFGIVDAVVSGIMGGPSDAVVPVTSVYSLPYASHMPALPTEGSKKDAMHTGQVGSSLIYDRLKSIATAPIYVSALAAPPPVLEASGSTEGIVAPGQTQTSKVVLDGSGSFLISLIHGVGTLGWRLISPSGRVITSATPASDPLVGYEEADLGGNKILAFRLEGARAETGTWTVEVTGTNVTNPAGFEPYFLNGWATSTPIALQASTTTDYLSVGDSMPIYATLTNGGMPLLGAIVSAEVVDPAFNYTTVSMRDDGTGGDMTAADGIYTAIFTATSGAGNYGIVVNAEGTSPSIFSRSIYLTKPVASIKTEVTGTYKDQGVDDNGNGLFDRLVVTAGLRTTGAADFRYVAVLTAPDGTEVGRTSGVTSLTAGEQDLPLEFDGRRIFGTRKDGPYSLQVFRVAEESDTSVMPLAALTNVHTTDSYAFGAFEHEDIVALRTGTDMGVDTNANGLFDELDVMPRLLIATPGFYQWSARLEDSFGKEIGFASGSGNLISGENVVPLTFEGLPIGENGVPGPYFVRGMLINSTGTGASANLADVYETSGYAASEFEGYVARADLGLAMTRSPSPAVAGEVLTYSMVATNAGPDAQSEVKVQFTPPSGLAIESVVVTPSGTTWEVLPTGMLEVLIGALAVNSQVTISVVVRPGESQAGTVITANASISGLLMEDQPNDNQASVDTEVVMPPVDLVAPRIVSMTRYGYHAQPTWIVLRFDELMEATSVENARAYKIMAPGRDGRIATRDDAVIPIKSVRYDATAGTATLLLGRRLSIHVKNIVVVSASGNGLRSSEGVALDGDGDGTAGGDYVKVFDARSLHLPEQRPPGANPGPLPRRPPRSVALPTRPPVIHKSIAVGKTLSPKATSQNSRRSSLNTRTQSDDSVPGVSTTSGTTSTAPARRLDASRWLKLRGKG